MKIKHIWSVLCKESVIDQADNNVSIHGVLEQLTIVLTLINKVGKLPEKLSVPLNYEIVSLWQRSKEIESIKGDIEYILLDPDNKELLKNTQSMEIPKISRRFRSRMKISGLPLSKEGDYTLQVKVKEAGANTFHLVAEIPLEIKINLEKSQINSQLKN